MDVAERLLNTRIDHLDARDLLGTFVRRPASLIYLDPPYVTKRSKGYNKDTNDEEFHIELLKIANKCKSMVFISGYENELYNSLLTERKGWEKKYLNTYTKTQLRFMNSSNNKTSCAQNAGVAFDSHHISTLRRKKFTWRLISLTDYKPD